MGRVFKPTQIVRREGKVIGRKPTRNWYVEWTDHTGRVRRESIGADKALAHQALAAREKEAAYKRAGLPVPGTEPMDLEALTERYLREAVHRQGPKHYREVKAILLKIQLETGARTSEELTAQRVAAYLDDLARAGRSGRTQNKHLGVIQASLNWAHQNRLLPQPHPVSLLSKRPERRCRTRRALTQREAAMLLTAAGPGDERLAYLLALYAGLRQGEIAGLRWGDINLEARQIVVRPELDKARRGATLPAHGAIIEALEIKYQAPLPGPHEPVVRLARRPAERLAATLDGVGIPYIDGAGRVADFHALRHTCLTWLNQAGCDPRTLQALARHASPTTTLGIYVHRDRERERMAIEDLPNWNRPPSEMATG